MPVRTRLRPWLHTHPLATSLLLATTAATTSFLLTYSLGFRRDGIKQGIPIHSPIHAPVFIPAQTHPDSPAADWQRRTGPVGPGSAFAVLQSAGAGGKGAWVVLGGPAVGAVVLVGVVRRGRRWGG